MNYTEIYFEEVIEISRSINKKSVDNIIFLLKLLKKRKGRCFFIGVGGSSANCSHAVNDFRKLLNIESYSVSENVSELTARINDDGWDTCYSKWLFGSNLNMNDCIFVLSVGGGSVENNVSMSIVNAIDYAKEVGADIVGIVGRDGGYTAKNTGGCIVVPVVSKNRITPHSEAFQSVILHLIVSHPQLQENIAKWEKVDET